jgi:TRAP-type C4-dicarboxylate transport system permease small subunit
MKPRTPLFNRFIATFRRPWLRVGLGLLLVSIAFSIVFLSDLAGNMPFERWRSLLISPTVIAYVLLIAPSLARTDEQVIAALRPLILVSDAEFDRLTDKATYTRPAHELAACAVGLGFGIAMALPAIAGFTPAWTGVFSLVTISLMYALLAWMVYAAIAGARMTSALYRQPMRVSVLDTAPFEVVGRQSLLLALAFIGGITLSLVIGGVQQSSLQGIGFWLSYAPIIAAPVIIFFLNMLATHRVLAQAKNQALADARRQLEGAGRDLVQQLKEKQDTGAMGAVVATLVAYEKRLNEARTWPYNTAMIRTLFLSVLVPIGTLLLQMIIKRFFP